MRRVLVTCLLLTLSACVTTMPQTRGEFKDLAANHPTWYIAEKYLAKRSFDDVVRTMDNKWQACYNASKTTTRNSGGMTTSQYSDEYHPKTKKVNNSLVEMTIQMTTKGMVMLDKTPPGGYYHVALDIKRAPDGKAALTWYSANAWKEEWTKNKQWAEGKNVSCDE